MREDDPCRLVQQDTMVCHYIRDAGPFERKSYTGLSELENGKRIIINFGMGFSTATE
jgi:hypothetical protein